MLVCGYTFDAPAGEPGPSASNLTAQASILDIHALSVPILCPQMSSLDTNDA
jgi:hypothetical protein